MKKGFTLIELAVVVAVIAILSAIILSSVTKYINSSKDATLSANLAILISSGEVYYNNNGSDHYKGFCNPSNNSVFMDIISKVPHRNNVGNCGFLEGAVPSWSGVSNPASICCGVDDAYGSLSWAACAPEFSDPSKAFCVDSRGVKEEIDISYCTSALWQCP